MPGIKCKEGCGCDRHFSKSTGENHWRYDKNPTIATVHKRVRKEFGPASNKLCIDCKGKARDWSHAHNTNPFDIYNYSPRCRSCHVKYDLKRDKSNEGIWQYRNMKRELD